VVDSVVVSPVSVSCVVVTVVEVGGERPDRRLTRRPTTSPITSPNAARPTHVVHCDQIDDDAGVETV
jgi:hypothetical protein